LQRIFLNRQKLSKPLAAMDNSSETASVNRKWQIAGREGDGKVSRRGGATREWKHTTIARSGIIDRPDGTSIQPTISFPGGNMTGSPLFIPGPPASGQFRLLSHEYAAARFAL